MNSALALDLAASNGTNVSHIERFQSLQSGQYWRATREISREAITEGMVLLIQSIRWVEEKPHTIILRSHPTVIGRPQTVRWVDEHGEHERTAKFTEHRILLDDFLAGFEFEPHAKQFRDRELQQAQAQVQQLQAELLTAQSNPEVMAAVVRLRLSSPDDAVEGAPGSSLAVQFDPSDVALATGTVSQALNTELTESRIDQLRSAAVQQHSLAAAKASWIQEKTKEIGRAISAITPFFEEQAAAALASTEEVREYALKLSKGIESLDLYVGRGVTVETITTGESAPAEEPLTFVQKKLFMCEELAIWADVGDTFDFEDEHIFFDALRAKPALVEQIFPAKRCVLCMAVTRDDVNYKDAFTSAERNAENKSVFLLVRDGDNIHRVFSPVESHRYFTRLFPSVEESEARFTGIDGTTIKFEDVAYTDHLAKHEAAALHYKRLLILACGLDHRLKLFGHFYPEKCGFDFVSLQFQVDYCRFIHDDDQHSMLQGKPLQPLQEWIAECNKYLTSGSRVICNWRALMNPDTAPGACTPTRDSFILNYKPGERFGICKVAKSGADLVVEVPVHGYTNRGEERDFNCRVNLSAYRYGYWRYEDLAYLCLDTVREEDLNAYMRSRETRRDHVYYIRLFKHALAHLQAERSEEMGTRQMMREALIEGAVCDVAKIDAVIEETVRSWRAANRGAPLPRAEAGISPRQWQSILDQMYVMSGNGNETASLVSELLGPLGMAPLRLVSNGKTGLAVYAAPAHQDRDDRLFPHEWVKRITLPLKKGRLSLGASKDVRLSQDIASEVTIHEWPAAQAWLQISPSSFESLASKSRLMAQCEGATEKLLALRGPMNESAFEFLFNQWHNARHKANRKGKFVANPHLFVPVGMLAHDGGKKLQLLGVGSTDAHVILYKLAPTEEGKQRVRHAYVSIYSNKRSAAMRFDDSVQETSNWALLVADVPGPKTELGLFTHDSLNVSSGLPSRYGVEEVASPLLGDQFQAFAKQWGKDKSRYWLHPSVANQNGALDVDATLGIELPQDFRPVRVFDVRFTEGKVHKYSWLITEPDAVSSDFIKQGSYRARLFPTISAARTHIQVSAASQAEGTDLRLQEAVGSEPAVIERFDLG